MAKTVDKSNLGYLGVDFQYKLVKCLIEDQKFFIQIYHIIDQNMFTDEHLRRIVGFMKDRYNLNESVATYADLRIIARSKIMDAISVEMVLSTLDKIENYELSAIDIIEDESEKFFKQQNLTRAINQASEIIKKGVDSDYYKIEDLIKKALEVNTKQNYGWRLFESIESDLNEDYRITIPTGANELDKALYGGLGKGELGIVVAPLGTGKTSCTTGFAAAAAICKKDTNNNKGFKVLHFYFEDEDVNIRRKYYGYVTDIDACNLSLPEYRPIAIAKLNENSDVRQMLYNNIIGERLPSGDITASEIKNKIKSYIAKGFKPDLVIVDYFECIKPEKSDLGDTEWTKEGITMRKLESTANELNIAMWVPVQGTKDSIGAAVVGLTHAGGSVKKTQIGHVVITLAQTDEQKAQGLLTMFIGKLRAAKVGRNRFENVHFNNGTLKFDFTEEDVEFDKIQPSSSVSMAKQARDMSRKNYY